MVGWACDLNASRSRAGEFSVETNWKNLTASLVDSFFPWVYSMCECVRRGGFAGFPCCRRQRKRVTSENKNFSGKISNEMDKTIRHLLGMGHWKTGGQDTHKP